MRVVALSDTHTMHEKIQVPDGDLLIYAGDSLSSGGKAEFMRFRDWWMALPHKRKVLIAGNHDWFFEHEPALVHDLLPGTSYLCDSGGTLSPEEINIWGSPYTPEFCNWAFNVTRGLLYAKHWRKIPQGLDILITHGPPLGILDQKNPRHPDSRDVYVQSVHLGDEELARAVQETRPKHHIFGHIHGSGGLSLTIGETTYHNAAIVDEAYRPAHQPIVFEV
jgi:predicted phosphohydrolase